MIQSNSTSISYYTPYISFKPETETLINEKLIKPAIDSFFSSRDITNYESVNPNNYISDVDFHEISFAYFYEQVITFIRKEKGKIQNKVKYIITFDKDFAKQKCAKTGHLFDDIKLNKQVILYFIYIDFQDVMRFIKDDAKHAYKPVTY